MLEFRTEAGKYTAVGAPTSYSAGICKQSMGARNRVEIGLSYRPAKLQKLAEWIPWSRFLDPEKSGSDALVLSLSFLLCGRNLPENIVYVP